jgi:hypothetical protein
MTELDWLAGNDPAPMLDFVRARLSERKARLFAVACCQRIEDLLPDEWGRKSLAVAERFADGQASDLELLLAAGLAYQDAQAFCWRRSACNAAFAAVGAKIAALGAAFAAAQAVAEPDRVARFHELFGEPIFPPGPAALANERIAQCELLRCLAGNPWRPVSIDPGWLAWDGGTVRNLARTIYEQRLFECLPILGDALEDAGCAEDRLLRHCRQGGAHARGCWVVDELLRRE